MTKILSILSETKFSCSESNAEGLPPGSYVKTILQESQGGKTSYSKRVWKEEDWLKVKRSREF